MAAEIYLVDNPLALWTDETSFQVFPPEEITKFNGNWREVIGVVGRRLETRMTRSDIFVKTYLVASNKLGLLGRPYPYREYPNSNTPILPCIEVSIFDGVTNTKFESGIKRELLGGYESDRRWWAMDLTIQQYGAGFIGDRAIIRALRFQLAMKENVYTDPITFVPIKVDDSHFRFDQGYSAGRTKLSVLSFQQASGVLKRIRGRFVLAGNLKEDPKITRSFKS